MTKERQLLHRAATYLQNDCSDGAEKLRAEIEAYLEVPEAEPVTLSAESHTQQLVSPRQPVQLSDDEIYEI